MVELELDEAKSLNYNENPLTWPQTKKRSLSIIVIMTSATMVYYSGAHIAFILAIVQYYHNSQLASISGVSFFLLGFVIGSLFFVSLSEMFGRRLIIRVSLLLFIISNVGCALAPNIQTLLAFRLIGGLLGAPTGLRPRVDLRPKFFAPRMTAKISSSHEHGGLAERYVAAERAGSPAGAVYGCELPDICDRSDM